MKNNTTGAGDVAQVVENLSATNGGPRFSL